MDLRLVFLLGLMLVLMGVETQNVWSSSTFALPQSTFLGQNFDWHVWHGQILVNKKNIRKRSLRMFDTDQSFDWVSQYGSLTFNQIALDHPMSGMNQAGLTVVASENFGEGDAKAKKRLTINEYQWVQYQLDNYATLKEVIEHVNDIGISSLLQECHYMVCDASTQCAAFEVSIANHQLKIYSGRDFPVRILTDTGYSDVLKKYVNYVSQGSPKFQLDPFDSNDRFLFLAVELSAVPTPRRWQFSFDGVLSLLGAVKQPGFTQWQIAFDSAAKKIRYKTELTNGIGLLDLTSFDFSSDTGVQAVDIHEYITISPKPFHVMTHEDNVKLVDESMSYLGSVLPVGGEQKLKSYPAILNSDGDLSLKIPFKNQ